MKMSIRSPQPGYVTITYDDDRAEGGRVTREFSVRNDGERHYVLEHAQERLDGIYPPQQQVCERLSSRGNTLRANAASLADVIRREYRAMRAAERREAARYD
jgi:hypothetical protein